MKNSYIFLVALHRVCFRKIVLELINFQFFLLRKQPLVANLNKTRPLWTFQVNLKLLNCFGFTPLIFDLE